MRAACEACVILKSFVARRAMKSHGRSRVKVCCRLMPQLSCLASLVEIHVDVFRNLSRLIDRLR